MFRGTWYRRGISSTLIMNIIIKRTYLHNGTNGALFIGGKEFCKTIELPWKDNHSGTSCIPEGVYNLTKRTSEHLGDHILVNNVQGREYILIHKANDALKELRGCIAPVTTLTGEGQGNASKARFDPLRAFIYSALDSKEKVTLTIVKA